MRHTLGGIEGNKHLSKKVKGTQGRSTKTKSMVTGIKQRDGKVKAEVMAVATKTMQAFIDNNTENVDGDTHANSIESVWAILKRAHKGTFHNISKKHLQKYVDEISFRFSDGNVDIDTIDRMVSLANGMTGKRLKYRDLIAK